MKLKYLILALITLVIGACKKELDVKVPDFEVSASTVTVTAGQPVIFNFQGNANNIAFYSGENLKDYTFSAPATREVTNLPDRPTILKGYGDPTIPSYSYTYKTAGTYTATFVVSNATIDQTKEVVKQIEITVTP